MTNSETAAPETGPTDPKPASAFTQARRQDVMVDFDDATDFAAARQGLVAELQGGRITREERMVWDVARYDFLRTDEPAPDTVHPGLWRQGQLNSIHGLFEITDGVWQARGYDLSNVTFLATDSGWLVIDPLTTEDTARACLQLANDTLGARPVVAVIYTHSHIDHFGGVLGVTTQAAVDAGEVRIIAPEGFMEEAVSENGTAGPIMIRRAHYQFGPFLPPGPQGHVDCGLGQTIPIGQGGLIAPTEIVSETGTELDIDGIRVVFQNTPDAEAPAEMNFFFPQKRLLCMAENCTHTLHNLYPIRGAQTRDALAWSKYINEALLLWGDDTDIMFASHHWPRFGNDDVRAFLSLQRDVYRWMHDQTLRLANHGFTPDEISEALDMPDSFSGQSHVQGYYGTVSHGVRSVYNRYLGWYDGNPSHLHPLPPTQRANRYVALMGGADAVVAGAQAAFDDGDYRWVVELCNHVVFDDPTNQTARNLSADAMEQLGYQAESSTWRNAYLTGAFELRHGSLKLGKAPLGSTVGAMSGEQLIELMGVRFNPARFRGAATMIWTLTDVGPGGTSETHLVGVANSAIHQRQDPPGDVVSAAEATVSLGRAALLHLIQTPEDFDSYVDNGQVVIDVGDTAVVKEYLAALDSFQTQPIIEPRAE